MECDDCIGDFVASKHEKFSKTNDMMRRIGSYDQHSKICTNDELKKELDNFADNTTKILKSI